MAADEAESKESNDRAGTDDLPADAGSAKLLSVDRGAADVVSRLVSDFMRAEGAVACLNLCRIAGGAWLAIPQDSDHRDAGSYFAQLVWPGENDALGRRH